MARITSMQRLRQLNTMTIPNLSRLEKINLVTRGSDAIRKNVANSMKAMVKDPTLSSPFIERRLASGKGLPKAISLSKANKMTDTELNKTIEKLAQIAHNKTLTPSGMKEFNKAFREKTGVNYSDVSDEEWEVIREGTELYGSEEVFDVVSVIHENVDTSERVQAIKKGIEKIDYSTEALSDEDVPF